jgi:hypothetical protein
VINHSNQTYGTKRVTYYDGSSSVTSGLVSSLDEVSGVTIVKGDHKAPNNFSYTAQSRQSYRGTISRIRPGYLPYYALDDGLVRNGESVANLVSVPNNLNRLYNTALSRFYEKARGGLDLSISVLEGAQTYRMLNSIHKLSTYVEKNGPWWKNGLKGAGKNWLAYHLGWTPLVNDVYGACDEFQNWLRGDSTPMLISGSAKEGFKANQFPVSGFSGVDRYPSEVNGRQGVIFRAKFAPGSGFNIERWTALNPVSMAWELLPYSFVVDYFYDIGSMLRSLETACLYSSRFSNGYITYLRAVNIVHRIKGRRNVVSSDNYDMCDYISEFTFKNFRRERMGSAPLPHLPSFEVPTSWQKLTTMAGLLAQRLR